MSPATLEGMTRPRLPAGEEPALRAHLVTPRRLYSHHGLYVGGGRVIHYGGLARGLYCGPVEEVTLQQFARGRGIWVRTAAPRFDREQTVARARSRLGERRYRVLTNNCEHFCEWCLRGESRSAQVETRSAKPLAVLLAACHALSDLLPTLLRFGPEPDRTPTVC